MANAEVRMKLDKLRSLDCYEKLEQIGVGIEGKVFMAKERTTGEIVVLKKIRMDYQTKKFSKSAIQEIKTLKKLKHVNVIQLKEIVASPRTGVDQQESQVDWRKYKRNIYLVLEYMDHDLAGLAAWPGVHFSVTQIKCYMKQLLTGLQYCHANNVLHRNIKRSSILIDNEGNLKLDNFGLSTFYSDDDNRNLPNHAIPLWYRPIELLYGSTKYGPEVDMWSAGCVFAEILHGKRIFYGESIREVLDRIYALCGTPDEEKWPGVTSLELYKQKPPRAVSRALRYYFHKFGPSAADLLDKLLTLNPQERISAKDALESDYFTTEPLPCDPKSLPLYEPSRIFQTMKKKLETMKKQQTNEHPVHHGPDTDLKRGLMSDALINYSKPNAIVNYPYPCGAEGGNNENRLDPVFKKTLNAWLASRSGID